MILRSCYIENYGTLSQISVDFKENLTVFCEENGYGKTTLVSFLKAMFYGLPSYKTSNKGFPERQHYYPFNGGKFGGNLTFEHEGRTYRVERFFDKKSDTKDECRIFCDTLETQEFGKDGELLGRTFFKIDEESFLKTVFVQDLSTEFSMTTDLGVALNRLVDDTDDDRNFEAAIKKLNDRRKELHTDRGNRGLIPDKKAEIRSLEEQIGKFKNIHQRELESRYAEKKEAHQKSLEAAIALDLAMQRSYWDIYDEKQKQIAEKKAELEKIRQEYPHGIPSAEERAKLTVLLKALGENLALSKQTEDENAQKRLSKLSFLFKNKIPSESDLVSLEALVLECERLHIEIETVRKGAELDNVSQKITKFQKKMPTESELDKLRENAKRYRESQDILQSFDYRLPKSHTAKRKNVLICVLGASLVAFGLLLSLLFLPIGAVMLLTGMGALGFGLFGIFADKKKKKEQALALDAKIHSMQSETDILRRSLIELLAAFEYHVEKDPNLTYEHFCHDLENHCSFLERQKKTELSLKEKESLLFEKEKQVNAFFQDYSFESSEEARQKLHFLRDSVKEYERITSNQKAFLLQKETADARAKEILDQINRIYFAYEIQIGAQTLTHDFLISLASVSEREVELKKVISSLQADAEKHKNTYQLNQRTEAKLEEPLDFYREACKTAQIRESELESRIRELEFELEELPELENALALAKETLEKYERAYRTISETVRFLQKAEQNLMDRYVMPVRDSYCAYAANLESKLGENIHMDKEYKLSFERGGELRSDKHLSAGQYTISSLCMRLALAEQIYGDQLPFFILDDPFVHLDEKHLPKALRAVVSLSKKTQILYLTCHSVRAQFEE